MSRLLKSSWTVGALALLAAGCGGSDLPKGHPVTGKIVLKGKSANLRQLAGGKIRWQSTTDPKIMAVGVIEDDGTFSLGAVVNERSVSGVPAGTYKARFEPRAGDEPDAGPAAPVHAKYLDYDKSNLTFTVPLQGEIVIELDAR